MKLAVIPLVPTPFVPFRMSSVRARLSWWSLELMDTRPFLKLLICRLNVYWLHLCVFFVYVLFVWLYVAMLGYLCLDGHTCHNLPPSEID